MALGDEISALLGVRPCAMLLGGRPGLSVADSLGAYLTYAPEIGRRGSERNCVLNIHPRGLDYDRAADKLCWLIVQALTRRLTGIGLKDDEASSRERVLAADQSGGRPQAFLP